jgi:hypothetical protein
VSTIIAAGAGLTVVRGLRSGMHGWMAARRGEDKDQNRARDLWKIDDGTMESPMGSQK